MSRGRNRRKGQQPGGSRGRAEQPGAPGNGGTPGLYQGVPHASGYGAGPGAALMPPPGPPAPAPVAAPPPMARSAVQERRTFFGPIGKIRSPVLVVLLSIVTLGLYSPIWHTFINGEMSDFDPRLYVRPRPSGWAVALPWIIGVAGTALGVLRTLAHTGHLSFPHQSRVPVEVGYGLLGSLLAVPYLALILPVSLVAIVMTLERIRLLEDRVGVPLEHQLHPSRMVWWLLLPVVGGLVLIAREQGRLDRVWLRAEQLPQQRVATR